jgi:Fe-Mn family superoxide dismutase
MFSLAEFPLKFSDTALQPFMSALTLDFHYNRHLDTYIKNLNTLIANTKYEHKLLEEIVKESFANPADKKVFNNAAQVFNHNFFFRGLTLDSGAEMPAEVAKAFVDFDKEFKAAAMSVFGSGWVWLIKDGDDLKIETTANADTPIARGRKPLLALDVWEHAYYLDYQNRRSDFVDAFLQHLVDWDFVAGQLS